MKNNKKVVLLSALTIASLIVLSGIALATAKAQTNQTRTPLYKVRANIATGGKVEVTTNYLNKGSVTKVIAANPSGSDSETCQITSCVSCIPDETSMQTNPGCASCNRSCDPEFGTSNPFYCVTQNMSEPSCGINNCESSIGIETCSGGIKCFFRKLGERLRAAEVPECPPLGGVIDRTY
jgi:hypothetical protein